jgi:hypothetical protein
VGYYDGADHMRILSKAGKRPRPARGRVSIEPVGLPT